MARPYSYEVRIRVVAAVEKGMGVKEASHTFGVHRDTILGVVAHGEATVAELAEAWGGVKRMTIWRQLRKLGYTHKKRPSAMPSATKH